MLDIVYQSHCDFICDFVWRNIRCVTGWWNAGSETMLNANVQQCQNQHPPRTPCRLLERFLELGPWAVRKALSVGIFPYVFKLLGSPSKELKPVLISLWTKVLAVDAQCKTELSKSPASPIRRGSVVTIDLI
jgi:hypothetical protein